MGHRPEAELIRLCQSIAGAVFACESFLQKTEKASVLIHPRPTAAEAESNKHEPASAPRGCVTAERPRQRRFLLLRNAFFRASTTFFRTAWLRSCGAITPLPRTRVCVRSSGMSRGY